jgi:hypothetical protein
VGSWIGIGQEKGNVLGGPIGGDPKLAEWLRKVARPAGLEPATSWFVGNSRYAISLVLRGFGSDETLLLAGVRRHIVHRLFTAAWGEPLH